MTKQLTWLVIVLVLLNVLDFLSTHYALSIGAVEINPLMARGFDSGVAVLYKAAAVVMAIGLTVWRVRQDFKLARTYFVIYAVCCVIYAVVLINNIVVIAHLRTLI